MQSPTVAPLCSGWEGPKEDLAAFGVEQVSSASVRGGRLLNWKLLTVAAAAAATLSAVATTTEAEELVAYEIVDFSIAEPLTSEPGDAERGRAVVINRQLGNCLSCHAMPIPEQAFHGEVGPPLDGVGDRLDEGQLRMQVVNSHELNPYSMMPAFYDVGDKHRVSEQFEGKPILSAQQVEDVVAYLTTLKE